MAPRPAGAGQTRAAPRDQPRARAPNHQRRPPRAGAYRPRSHRARPEEHLSGAPGRNPGVPPVSDRRVNSTYDQSSYHRRVQRRVHRRALRTIPARSGFGRRDVAPVFPGCATAGGPGVAAAPAAAPTIDVALLRRVAGAAALMDAIRIYGHFAVRTDPLGSDPPGAAELQPAFHGITEEDLKLVPAQALGFES